jgi:hypothetical protein
VSARHQVKRLDRTLDGIRAFEAGAAEETSFLRSLRIRGSVRNFILAASAEVKSWS